MARSYFSRMVRGGGSVALAPSRPVSNLWKSAQMEGAAVESAVEAPAEVPFRRVRAGAALDPATEPVVRPSAETKTETREVAPMRARKVVKSSVALPETAPQESAPQERTTPKAARFEQSQKNSPREERAVRFAGEAVTAKTAAVQRPEPDAPKRDAQRMRRVDPDVLPSLEPVRTLQQDAPTRVGQPRAMELESAAVAAPEVKREAVAAPVVEVAPARREEPVRHRERTAWNAPAQEESRTSSGNSVQIGKIEVQVISPPAPVRYAAAPAAPKGRLARGYTLWQAWQ
jgi:hypothetical protein